MSTSIALLLGLLVVAFVGSQLIGRSRSAYRLPSGGEYLLLGIALGPHALGLVERGVLATFEPLAAVATAWLTLVIGAEYGYQRRRRVSRGGLVTGVLLSMLSAALIAGAAYFVASRFSFFERKDLWILAAGVGLVGCETTRHAVSWVLRRHSAEGPLARLIDDVADADDLVPIVGLAVLLSFAGHPEVDVPLPWWGWASITAGIGLLLGATATALLRAEPRASDGWGVLIGAVLLTVGITWRLELAAQAATFMIGIGLSALSRHGRELRSMLRRSEQPVLLPTLLLAGARVALDHPVPLLALLAIAFASRALVRLALAPIIVRIAGVRAGLAPLVAAGLLPSGALSIAVGLAVAARFPGAMGDTVLGVSVGLTLLGEVAGPGALRRALEGAGEIPAEPRPERFSDAPERFSGPDSFSDAPESRL